MLYSEIVEKMKIHAPLTVQEVSAEQMFHLYKDRYMKYISYHGNQYELNLVPVEPGEKHVYELIREYDTFNAFAELVELFIKNTQNNRRSFLICEHKEYEVIMELMESNE